MLNGNHDFSIWNVLELLEHLKFESVLVLILNLNTLEDSVINELISKAHIAVEFVFSNQITQKGGTYWSGAFIATVKGLAWTWGSQWLSKSRPHISG